MRRAMSRSLAVAQADLQACAHFTVWVVALGFRNLEGTEKGLPAPAGVEEEEQTKRRE
jgi:hypothetical protein